MCNSGNERRCRLNPLLLHPHGTATTRVLSLAPHVGRRLGVLPLLRVQTLRPGPGATQKRNLFFPIHQPKLQSWSTNPYRHLDDRVLICCGRLTEIYPNNKYPPLYITSLYKPTKTINNVSERIRKDVAN